MSIEILDPTHEGDSQDFVLAPRLESLQGVTVGIISNGKKGSQPFFDAVEKVFIDKYQAAKVIRRTKSNYSAPADANLLQEAAQWDVLVAGVGD